MKLKFKLLLWLVMLAAATTAQNIRWEQIKPISAQVQKTTVNGNDLLLIEDSEASGIRKNIKISALIAAAMQTIDTLEMNGNNLQVSLSGDGQPQKSISLAQFLDNTDNQQIYIDSTATQYYIWIDNGDTIYFPKSAATAGSQNLTWSSYPDKGIMNISNGTGDTIPVVDSVNAGLMTPENLEKLEELDSIITKNGTVYIDTVGNVIVCSGTQQDSCVASLNDGLIAYYPMDETSGPVQDIIGGNNLTNHSATAGSEGRFGNSYYFNGNSTTYIDGTSPLNGKSEGTIALWVKFVTFSSTLQQMIIAGKFGEACPIISVLIDDIHIGAGVGTTTSAEEAAPLVNPDEWYFVVVRFYLTGTQQKTNVSINGVFFDNYIGQSFTETVFDDNLVIGGVDAGFLGFKYNGYVDEVKYWDRLLTNCEVTELSGLNGVLGENSFTCDTLYTAAQIAEMLSDYTTAGEVAQMISDSLTSYNERLLTLEALATEQNIIHANKELLDSITAADTARWGTKYYPAQDLTEAEVVFDFAAGNNGLVRLESDIELTLQNIPDGAIGSIVLLQDSTGGYVVDSLKSADVYIFVQNDTINQDVLGRTLMEYRRVANSLYVTYLIFPSNPINAPAVPSDTEYAENYTGTIYYFSADGSDSNTGLSKSAPKQTLAAASALSLNPGDAVLFNSVDTFVGYLSIGQSGNSTTPITYGAYGDASSKPIIYGSDEITGWTVHSGSIYKASYATTITQLFANDERLKAARYPNTGYATVTTVNTTTQFIASGIPSEAADYYKDAKWIGRTNEWVMQTRNVTTSTGNTLTLESAPTESLGVNEGFILVGKLEFLDEAGEWYYDAAADLVYVWLPDDADPSDYIMRGSTLDNGVYIPNSYGYIAISNLDFRQQKKNGVITTGQSNFVTISNCNFENQELMGIKIDGPGLVVSNNTFEGQNAYGLYNYAFNPALVQTVVAYNDFRNIALFDQLGLNGMGLAADVPLASKSGKAIETDCQNGWIHHNSISNIGYSGINFYNVNNIVEYNYVKDVCLVKDDGGGIYTWGSSADQATPGNNGSIIRYNIVDGVMGSTKGKASTALSGSGIYLDNNSGGVTVQNNIISHCSLSGVFLHEGKLNTVDGNTIFDTDYGVYTVDDTGINTISDNTIYALNYRYNGTGIQKLIGERLATYTHVYSGNTYYSHYNNDNIFLKTSEWTDPATDSYTFSEWQGLGYDATSTIDVTSLTAGATQSGIIINPTGAAKTFYLNDATATNLSDVSLSASFSHPKWSATIVTGMDLFKIADTDSVELEAETIHYMEDLAYQLTRERISVIDSTVKYLKTNLAIDSLNEVFDYFHLYGGETQESSLRDLVGSANATLSGTAPTFARYQGFTGNGSSSYINTQFTPSTSTTATLNNTSWGYYVRTQGGTSTGIYGALSTTADGGTANRVILSCPASTSDVFAVNAGLSNISFTSGAGLNSVNRVASGTHKAFYNGTEMATANVTSTKLPNQTLYLLARHEADGSTNYYGSDQVSASFFGRGLTSGEMLTIKAAIEMYERFGF